MKERVGNWMQTIGGRAFWPLDPRPEDVHIEDIAHALAFVCRFGGHCSEFYSVAEHSVRVAIAVKYAGGTPLEQFAALLHDAAEAYVGDMVCPLKNAEQLREYKTIEKAVERAIATRFGLPSEIPSIVKRFDLVLLSTEKRDLMISGPGQEAGVKREALSVTSKLGAWHCDEFAPLERRIYPWDPSDARATFLSRFERLQALVAAELSPPRRPTRGPTVKCTTCGHDICDPCWQARTQVLAERATAVAKAEQYERDWYAAKSDFGTAMARARTERDEARALAGELAEYCRAAVAMPSPVLTALVDRILAKVSVQ